MFDTTYNEIISLGTCCEVSFGLDTVYGKKFPFDWFRMYNYNDIVTILSNKFSDFPEFMYKTNIYNNDTKQVMCKHYDIASHKNHSMEIVGLKKACERRIKRFIQTVKDPDKIILFILKGHLRDGIISKEISISIRNAIRDINSNLVFSLVVINEIDVDENTEEKEYTYENILFVPIIRHPIIVNNIKIIHHCNARYTEYKFWENFLCRFDLKFEENV